MKKTSIKTTLLLLLLSAIQLRLLANRDNDTILNYAYYASGEIELLSNNGELYQFAQDKDGFKYIYYLFTSSEYLHLEKTDVEKDDSHYCLDTQDASIAVWYNSETKQIADPSKKWALRYAGTDQNNNEYVSLNPNKCLWWKDGNKPIQLLFNVDNNREKKADGSTVQLYVMTPFIDKINPNKLFLENEGIKLNYGSKVGKSPNDFKNDTVFSKKTDTLNGVEYVITRSDRAIIDSITANGVVLPIEDIPGGPREIVAKLDNIPIERGNNINIKIHYRYFDHDGKITRKTDAQHLPINWERAKWWNIFLTIFAILAFTIVFAIIFIKVMNKKNKKGKGRLKSFIGNLFAPKKPQGQNQTSSPEETTPTSQQVEQPSEGQPKQNTMLVEQTQPESPLEQSQHEMLEEQVKKLIIDIDTKDKELESVRLELNDVKQQLKQTKKSLAKANSEINNAQIAAHAKYEQEVKELKAKVEAAQKAQQAAEQARDDAEENARQSFETEFKLKVERLMAECNAKVEAAQQAQQEAEQARDDAEANARQKLDEEFRLKEERLMTECNAKVEAAQQAQQKAEHTCKIAIERQDKDRESMLGKLLSLANRLESNAKQMNEDAFNGNCGTIRSGASLYASRLHQRIENGEWKDKTTRECLEELRTEFRQLLDYGTDSWINLLGRLYSYMSVAELRQQLLAEGLSFDLVSETFDTMQALLATTGIIVLNCSPGFDSGSDPVTARFFNHESSIDRVTNWLGGNEAVDEAIPNHGQTVYDFGQLAYFTTDDLQIHKGSVIYYNS